MWARNESHDAERAQDDVDFGASPGDGGNQFLTDVDESGHVMFRAQNKAIGPSAGYPNFHENLHQAIEGLYKESNKRNKEEDCPVEASHQTTGVTNMESMVAMVDCWVQWNVGHSKQQIPASRSLTPREFQFIDKMVRTDSKKWCQRGPQKTEATLENIQQHEVSM
jgi:hypothetical protein